MKLLQIGFHQTQTKQRTLLKLNSQSIEKSGSFMKLKRTHNQCDLFRVFLSAKWLSAIFAEIYCF